MPMKQIQKKQKLLLLSALILCGGIFLSGCILQNSPGVQSNGNPDHTSAKSTFVSPHMSDSGMNMTDAEPPLPVNGTGNRSVEGESTPVPPIATTPPRV
jgi:hypothetical protein